MAADGEAGVAACRMSAPHLLQNAVPVEGAPHLLQNLVAGGFALTDSEAAGGGAGAGAAGGVAGCGGGLAASRVSAPHFTQNIPLTGAPHLLQKLAMIRPSCYSASAPALGLGGQDAHRTAGRTPALQKCWSDLLKRSSSESPPGLPASHAHSLPRPNPFFPFTARPCTASPCPPPCGRRRDSGTSTFPDCRGPCPLSASGPA